ncbi:MAG: hypothetical protein QOJ07_3729 [Thermoleophilaceae bacterium]|nr:hypothetical protein [Thermoleophilaceae bacterium]
MPENHNRTQITRRRALALGGGVAGGLIATSPAARAGIAAARAHPIRHQHGKLPYSDIQTILEAEGSVTGGVLGVGMDRDDIGTVKKTNQGVSFPPSFQIHHDLFFQPLGDKLAFFNGDVALRPAELNPVIDAVLSHGLTFQAQHQHFFDLDPMVWFIHFRGTAEPKRLAHAVRDVIKATGTPLPQKSAKPDTPLDVKLLEKTLHGTAEVGANGVVTVDVSRKDTIVIDGIATSPDLNISTNIEFVSLDGTDKNVAVAPDFSMRAGEIAPVIGLARKYGFEIGCLYNQETSEEPQLYFSHAFKVGDPYAIASEIRRCLNHTRSD